MRDRISKLSIAWSRGRLIEKDYEAQSGEAEMDLRDTERHLANVTQHLQSIHQVDEVELDRIAVIVASGLFKVDGELEDVLDYVEGQSLITFTTAGESIITPDAKTPKGRTAWELRQRVFEALKVRIEIWGNDFSLDIGVPLQRVLLDTSECASDPGL